MGAQDRFVATPTQTQVLTPPVLVLAATSEGTFDLDRPTFMLTVNLEWTNLSGAPQQIALHQPAPPGAAAPIFNVLDNGANGLMATDSLQATIPVTAGDITILEQGLFYVEFITAANPAGELRGQILPNNAAYF